MVEKNMILVISTLFLISSVTSHSQCVQTSPCSCILPDGSGYDFSVLGQQRFVRGFTLTSIKFYLLIII